MTTILGESRSVKKILYPGKYLPTFANGAKLKFHFKCNILSEENDEIGPLLDDSRKVGRPMELIVGKQFKLPVWEECLKTMWINEVCQLDINKQNSIAYPVVSKSYRQFAGILKEEFKAPCCGMAALQNGIGQTDLDKLIHTPQKLRFVIELVEVQEPGDYEKESWSMTPEEKLQSIPHLKEEGNRLYKLEDYKGASKQYFEALNRLEQLMLREKPEEEEWFELEKLKRPVLLNYAQCKLLDGDYYSVIDFTTQVLQHDPDNVKALYKRAKAYVGVWDLTAAREDYIKVLNLDASLSSVVKKELTNLDALVKQKDTEDKAKYAGKLF